MLYSRTMNVLRSLKHRPFALLSTGQTTSRLGHSLYRIALALGSFVLLPIGFSLSGWATDLFGAPTVFLIGGLGTMALASLGLFHPAIRALD
ncbi:MAG TPA: hypothetical protein VI753_12675 [Anaerolineales bacterium]|nr:hypothetical protein [Anaerolineales bacterium]